MADLIIDRRESTAGGVATATFSPCGTYRYGLTRQWSAAPAVTWVMLNPSTADVAVSDATIRRCLAFSRDWGAGGITVVNLFALRSTDPAILLSHPDPIGPENDQVIRTTLNAGGPMRGPVVVGWGVHRLVRDRAAHVLELLRSYGVEPQCLGRSKDGWPRHPLYLRSDAALEPYDGRILHAEASA